MKRIALATLTLCLAAGSHAVPPGTEAEIAERLKPFGSVCRTGEDCGGGPVQAASGAMSGEQIYNQFCFACHAAGVGGAPRLGNADDWQARVDQGMDALMATTLNGLNAMPPKGTCMACSDEELEAVVTYMLEQLP